MNVFTYYDPELETEPVGHIVRLWEINWRHHGWESTLLVPRLAQHHPNFRTDHKSHADRIATYWNNALLAFDAQDEAGLLVDFRTFNFGLSGDDLPKYPRPYGLGEIAPGFALDKKQGAIAIHRIFRAKRMRKVKLLRFYPGEAPLVIFTHSNFYEQILRAVQNAV